MYYLVSGCGCRAGSARNRNVAILHHRTRQQSSMTKVSERPARTAATRPKTTQNPRKTRRNMALRRANALKRAAAPRKRATEPRRRPPHRADGPRHRTAQTPKTA